MGMTETLKMMTFDGVVFAILWYFTASKFKNVSNIGRYFQNLINLVHSEVKLKKSLLNFQFFEFP